MSVCGVHDDRVHADSQQFLHALVCVIADADRGCDQQPAMRVAARVRVIAGFLDVLYCDQSAQIAALVHHQHFFNAVAVQQRFHFFGARAFAHRDQPLGRRHDFADRGVHGFFKAQIAAGDDADRARAVHHRHAGDRVFLHQLQHIAHARLLAGGYRIADDAALVFFYAAHFLGLRARRAVAVNDADSAGLRQAYRGVGAGDAVHRRRQQRQIQRQFAGKTRAQIGFARQQRRARRQQQHIVKGQRQRRIHLRIIHAAGIMRTPTPLSSGARRGGFQRSAAIEAGAVAVQP